MEILRNLFTNRQDKEIKFSLVCLLVLTCIHFSLDLYLGKQAHLIVSSLLWSVLFVILWDQRKDFQANEDKISKFSGYFLVALLLVITIVRPGEKLVGFFPLVAFSGWFLIFFGFAQFKLHLKEFLVLGIFGLPKLISDSAFGLAPLTAHVSTYILWYLGHPVQLQDVLISVPNGSVEVVPACSGMNLIMHMLSVSVMLLCLSPSRTSLHKITLPFIAILLGFIMNSLRVALLAVLSPPQFSKLFYFWHSANGASIFVLSTLIIYSLIYFQLAKPLEE